MASIEYKKSPIKDSSEYRRVLLQSNHEWAQMDFMYDSNTRTPIYETYVQSSRSMFNDDNDNGIVSQPTERRGQEPVSPVPINLGAEMTEIGSRETSANLSSDHTVGAPPVNPPPPYPLAAYAKVEERGTVAGGDDCMLEEKVVDVDVDSVEVPADIEEEIQRLKNFLAEIDIKFPESVSRNDLHPSGCDLDGLARDVLDKVNARAPSCFLST